MLSRQLTCHGVEGLSIHTLCVSSSFILGWLLNIGSAPPLSAGDDLADMDSIIYGCPASYSSMCLLPILCHRAEVVVSQMDPPPGLL